MKTARGIYYNLSESEYILYYDNFKFYFSSKFYLEKFKKEYTYYILNESSKINSKYKCVCYADEVLLLNLYKSIEKKGFLVKYKVDNIYKLVPENYQIDMILHL